MAFPDSYIERVYAGVLGKIIGVYLGRPIENWTYERIMREIGEITFFVNDQLKHPLVVTDDDISGTFTFLRALNDYGATRDLSPAQIGQTWLNYLIENRTILWWGGLGNSTEHTAFLRLKHGIAAPESGSIARNTKIVAEQIGAQIFIDGWAMVAPGDPALAADLARRAASVSHDGEAIYAAQALAAMQSLAFVTADIDALLDCAVALIPRDSVIRRMIGDIREWHAEYNDWHDARNQIVANYGYTAYGGNCHTVPNHGLIILGLLYGAGDFQKSLLIANTSGWDTDCNSGNLGCLLGIRQGLAAFDGAHDWRGPIADRLYLPSADGGRSVTDAVRETFQIAATAYALAGESLELPKAGARFHFELPGSVQGFHAAGACTIENVAGYSSRGTRSLAVHYAAGHTASVATATFIPPGDLAMPGYTLVASPTVYAGQTVQLGVAADTGNMEPVQAQLFIQSYASDDALTRTAGPQVLLAPGAAHVFTWQIPDLAGAPIVEIGLALAAATAGSAYLDFVDWHGTPHVALGKPDGGGTLWRRAWVNGVDMWDQHWPEAFRLIQNTGTGLLIQGTREWQDYTVHADVRPHMVVAAGVAARVQGMRRYYALLLVAGGLVRLVKALDGEQILAEQQFDWQVTRRYELTLRVAGPHVSAWIDGVAVFAVTDDHRPLLDGAVALVCSEGRMTTEQVRVEPNAVAEAP